MNLQLSLLDPTQIYNIFEVELTKKPGRGLGLSIVGRKNEPGVYVSEVVKGGAAEADGRLMQGDQVNLSPSSDNYFFPLFTGLHLTIDGTKVDFITGIYK